MTWLSKVFQSSRFSVLYQDLLTVIFSMIALKVFVSGKDTASSHLESITLAWPSSYPPQLPSAVLLRPLQNWPWDLHPPPIVQVTAAVAPIFLEISSQGACPHEQTSQEQANRNRATSWNVSKHNLDQQGTKGSVLWIDNIPLLRNLGPPVNTRCDPWNVANIQAKVDVGEDGGLDTPQNSIPEGNSLLFKF